MDELNEEREKAVQEGLTFKRSMDLQQLEVNDKVREIENL